MLNVNAGQSFQEDALDLQQGNETAICSQVNYNWYYRCTRKDNEL